MAYQVIEPNNDPIYQDFLKHKVSGRAKDLAHSGRYSKFYKCSGLWNNGCKECSLADLERLIDWAAAYDCYESSDGTSLFVHGFSQNDMW